MAHYAFIDGDNIVVEVIPGRDEGEIVEGISDWEAYYSSKRDGLVCLRTSYNTWANEHAGDGVPFRGNFAGKGFTYDVTLDAFIAPQPYLSWTLDETTFQWVPPTEQPLGGIFEWDETNQEWVNV